MKVSNNGSEFTSNAILGPIRPVSNGITSLRGSRCRIASSRASTALLNETLFTSLANARVAIALWRADCNTARPHSQIAWQTPCEFTATFNPRRTLALRQRLRASARHFTRPTGHNPRRKRTQNQKKAGCNVRGTRGVSRLVERDVRTRVSTARPARCRWPASSVATRTI